MPVVVIAVVVVDHCLTRPRHTGSEQDLLLCSSCPKRPNADSPTAKHQAVSPKIHPSRAPSPMAAASAARSLVLFSSASFGLGRASSRLAVSSSSSSSGLLPRPALAFRGRSSFAATAVVMGKASAVDAEAGMDAVQRRLMFEDECILVDEQDNVIGHESKYNCHLMERIESGHVLHRAFSVFLFNSKYELLLQQRSTTKVTFPLVWTNTCCSHPLYRESELIEEKCLGVRNAAQRKLFDELGIQAEDLPVDQFVPLGRMLYKAPSDGIWGEHELDYLMFMVRDVKLSPNPEEVANVKYVNRDELKQLIKKADAGEGGIKLSPWFRLVVDNFLMDWWDHVEQGTLEDAVDKTIHKL